MRFVKPLDTDRLHNVFSKFKNVVTVEDGVVTGGFGSAVLEFMSDNNYSSNVVRLGIPDEFIEHGTPDELHKICNFDSESIFNAIVSVTKQKV
jgi:1-deoxy-D-xylulose-5-phosphate synthase